MRTAVVRHGKVAVRAIADPVPGPGQVLVRVLARAV
jgi:NADPH:quinone reductase-like Zn-dependent oxidoreductase